MPDIVRKRGEPDLFGHVLESLSLSLEALVILQEVSEYEFVYSCRESADFRLLTTRNLLTFQHFPCFKHFSSSNFD